MGYHWNKLNEETIGMHNGHCVINALATQKNEITEDELLERFITSTDEPADLVEYELKRILYNGLANGFIVKIGNNKYGLPSFKNIYEADCDESEGSKPSGMVLTISSPGRYMTLNYKK